MGILLAFLGLGLTSLGGPVAAVVRVLAAAFWNPVIATGVAGSTDAIIVIAGLLAPLRWPPIVVFLLGVLLAVPRNPI